MHMLKDPTQMMNELMTRYRGNPEKQQKLFSMTIDELYLLYTKEIEYKEGYGLYE